MKIHLFAISEINNAHINPAPPPHHSGGGQKSVAIHKQRDKVGFKKHTPRMKKNLKSAIFNGGFLRNLIFKDKNLVFLQTLLKNVYLTLN